MFTSPKWLLRLEGLVVLLVAILSYRSLGGSWVKFAALFLAPDIFMTGYLFGRSAGAAVYNIGHTYITPFLFALVFYAIPAKWLLFVPVIWASHIGFDRMLGYGLKYPASFKDTHFGRL